MATNAPLTSDDPAKVQSKLESLYFKIKVNIQMFRGIGDETACGRSLKAYLREASALEKQLTNAEVHQARERFYKVHGWML